jgi:uncharacterized caspase-like protein
MKKANPPRHRAVGAFLLLTSYFLLSTPAFAAKEALLIANAEYTNFGKLPNPIPDARKLADSLRQIGFQVALVENADREQMLDALGSFEERLKASRGIAFFHYGGHGVQVNGRNYLIPANADIPDEKRVATRAVELDEVMSALDASGSAANIVVLDACRDNPLPATTRSATRGLSVVQAKPKNSIIIYAAEAGSKAQDGLFTPILANAITAPGRSITDVVMQVRRQVNEQSGGTQTPGEYNQLFDPIVLNTDSQLPPSPQAAATPYQPPQIVAPPEPVQSIQSTEAIIRDYYRAVVSRDEVAVQSFFAETVNYLSYGNQSKAKVLADHRGDWKRYSGSQFEVSNFVSTGPASCQFILDYSLMQGERPRRGKLQMTATFTNSVPPKITSLKAKVISAK